MSTEWSASSLRQQQEHQAVLRTLEAQRIAQKLLVPTLPHEVRDALRGLGLPVRLFGENLANIRDRLRLELALQQTDQAPQVAEGKAKGPPTKPEEEEAVTKYTRASAALIEARNEIVQFSLERARNRLERERSLRTLAKKRRIRSLDERWDSKSALHDEFSELTELDQSAVKVTKQLRNLALEGSQYCDHRALSSVRVVPIEGSPLIVAASWTASLHVMNQELQIIGSRTHCHEDRIMGLDSTTIDCDQVLLATCSLDKTAKLFKFYPKDEGEGGVEMVDATAEEQNASRVVVNGDGEDGTTLLKVKELCHLQGHAARLCRVVFHPMSKHVATTSFDHTWRLWDVTTGECLLLQDGHAMECYGIGFHLDGSLVSTTDLGGIVHLWDLRVGKSIAWYRSHAGKVLNTDFHPNGFQMATAGQDGCIHVWDLRRRVKNQRTLNPQQSSSPLVSIPAHNSIVTKLRFAPSGEYVCSTSFDGLVKLWSCRTWKSINDLQGHESKVTCVDVLGDAGVVSTGFDKTVKLWR